MRGRRCEGVLGFTPIAFSGDRGVDLTQLNLRIMYTMHHFKLNEL